jgi:hypothetical protein
MQTYVQGPVNQANDRLLSYADCGLLSYAVLKWLMPRRSTPQTLTPQTPTRAEQKII